MSAVGARAVIGLDPLEGVVEVELARRLTQDPPAVRGHMVDLVGAGGKRLRPLMTMLAAQLGPCYDEQRSASLAAVLELIHSATLVHDDLVDASEQRRGRPTVRARAGARAAIAVGDYYFARAAGILAELACGPATLTVMRNVREVCRAQLLETNSRETSRLDEGVYLEIARGKTAALLVAACLGGAQLSGADSAVEGAMVAYAGGVGLAFQLVDDVIDFEDGGTGKPVGQDLRAGVWSLPVILACQELRIGPELRRSLADEAEVERAVNLVRESGALALVRRRAADLSAVAIAALDAVPRGPARTRMQEVAQQAVKRRA